jgi:hypothetical protein
VTINSRCCLQCSRDVEELCCHVCWNALTGLLIRAVHIGKVYYIQLCCEIYGTILRPAVVVTCHLKCKFSLICSFRYTERRKRFKRKEKNCIDKRKWFWKKLTFWGLLYTYLLLQFATPIAVSWDSVVGIATGYGLDDRGVGVRVSIGSRIFSSPRRPDRFWGPSSLLSNG